RGSVIDLHVAADPIDDDVVLSIARRESHAPAGGGAVGIEADAAGALVDQLLRGGVESDADPGGDRLAARPRELDGAALEIDGDGNLAVAGDGLAVRGTQHRRHVA